MLLELMIGIKKQCEGGIHPGIINEGGNQTHGVQLSAVNLAGESKGIQLGLYNLVEKSYGVQLSVLNAAIESGYGGQLGWINVTLEKLVGVQVGVLNYAKNGNYLQLGLITLRETGPWYTRFTPFIGFHKDGKKRQENAG